MSSHTLEGWLCIDEYFEMIYLEVLVDHHYLTYKAQIGYRSSMVYFRTTTICDGDSMNIDVTLCEPLGTFGSSHNCARKSGLEWFLLQLATDVHITCTMHTARLSFIPQCVADCKLSIFFHRKHISLFLSRFTQKLYIQEAIYN